MQDYPRDMIGYGADPPFADWPGGARVALQLVLNYEEGGENNVLHGDRASETFLSEIIGAQPFEMRHMSMESLYEYGSRAGLWRLLRLFRERRIPVALRRGQSCRVRRTQNAVDRVALPDRRTTRTARRARTLPRPPAQSR